MQAPQLAGKKLVFAPILRSGMGMLDGMLELVPGRARRPHRPLPRPGRRWTAVEYYFKAPADIAERTVIVIDPMLATGNTAVAAVDRLKETGATTIRFVCLLASPEGISKFHGPPSRTCRIWTAADRRAAERPRLHPAGPRRRRRPDVRHQIAGLRGRAPLG